jgi:hypothetical protein
MLLGATVSRLPACAQPVHSAIASRARRSIVNPFRSGILS